MTQHLKFQRNCYLFAIAIRPEFSKLLNFSSLQDSAIHPTNNSVDGLQTICLLYICLIKMIQHLKFQRNCYLFAIAIRPES